MPNPQSFANSRTPATGTATQNALGRRVAGVDEVGRGPLAGPVVAAAVILDPERPVEGLRDSKALTVNEREALALQLRACAAAYALGRAEPEEIDSINILQASMLAMRRAVALLALKPTYVVVDGNRCPELTDPDCVVEAVVGGDQKIPEVSAASILAKVARDQEMHELHRRYPQYGFAQHKGYPTAGHRLALQVHGPCPYHRRSFAPVRNYLQGELWGELWSPVAPTSRS